MEADEAEGGHVRAADAVRDLLEGEPARLAEEPRLQHAPAIAAASRPGFVPVRLRGGIGPENLLEPVGAHEGSSAPRSAGFCSGSEPTDSLLDARDGGVDASAGQASLDQLLRCTPGASARCTVDGGEALAEVFRSGATPRCTRNDTVAEEARWGSAPHPGVLGGMAPVSDGGWTGQGPTS